MNFLFECDHAVSVFSLSFHCTIIILSHLRHLVILDKDGIAYDNVDAEGNAELAKQHGVKQAPTLIISDGDSFERFAGAGAIKQYATAK